MVSDGLNTPLWAFSLAIYGAGGVAAECLDAQDRFGVDVNLLLFAAFAGAVEGIALGAQDIAAAADATAAWHAGIVRALRDVRRTLKPATLDEANPLRASATGLRGQVKAAELESEKIEQAMLWSWWQQQSPDRQRGNATAALNANLDAVLAHCGAPTGPAQLTNLRTAAIALATLKP